MNQFLYKVNMNEENLNLKLKNKGTGGGGSKTNKNGKKFEDLTNNEIILLKDSYTKTFFLKDNTVHNYYLSKKFDDKTITFVSQNSFKTYMKNKYNISVFRCPDEAYIIEYNISKKILIKILEKKNQNTNGSVETKLWASPSLKREYEILLGDDYKITYGLCLSDFLKEKITSNENKYKILNIILKEHNIDVLFGDDKDYFEKIDNWINNSL